jgi:hypothetical protein
VLLDLDSNTNWCLSGGADGSDLQFGMCAGALGHGVIHFSFRGHATAAPETEVVVLTELQLQAADARCRAANRTLRRRFPAKSPKITNLLRRNWYQVETAQSCYAVSTLDIENGPTIPLGSVFRAKVAGGTAWAVQMFIDRHKAMCPCYVFDQVVCHWFQWIGDGWQCIYEPPKPAGIYAGIGARHLLPIGKLAIRVLMDYKKRSDSPASREQAELIARQRFEERSVVMEGHKLGSWESLSDLMKEALIHHEMTRQDK